MSSSSSSRSRRFCNGEVLPFLLMIFLQCGQVALSTLFKKASSEGMNYMVFIFYSYAIAGLVLLPFSLIFERKKKLPQVNKQIVGRFILLGFLGYTTQMLGFKGIEFSSPTMASSMSNLTPAITFALAVLFRMEKVEMGRLSSRAKILGTALSIAGALVVVLYQGPTVIRTYMRSVLWSYDHDLQPLNSAHANWVIGGLLLIGDYILFSFWYIVQGLFGSSFATVLLTWGLHVKGPLYVALFTPFSIVIAAIMSVIFLGDSLYLGTVIGGVVISVGFYLCVWGKAKEEQMEEGFSFESGPAERASLLQ